LESLYIIDY